MAKYLIYLHGLGSKGTSPKSDALATKLKNVTVITPDLPLQPDDVIATIKKLIQELYDKGDLEKIVLCGTSLGGFYAYITGEMFDIPYVMVNPVTNPAEVFVKYLDNPPPNYRDDTPLIITEQTLKDFSYLESTADATVGLGHLFAAMDDEVVPCKLAVEKFHTSVLTRTGGHRYESEWSNVVSYTEALFE